ncbi:uncharacterized protein B0H18DRAFT_1112326 [Fomitopsis serialis]|uniref:uncharacterized protein n=1 Tax=Fomitopsis serialis TaxID=139415 RepID=UPI00200872D7|nr:uncharacterized protein B0H18DRAFT_1112326 [Neoantrodia serialis]KAH9938145.1 hypothetical protein B0H18DRAFT_1112326 [Neoantrodia serialis]
MSHLLHNPYNKPSPFDLPRVVQPLTPPDTDSEFLGQPFRSAPVHASAAETSTPYFRRQPSVSYISSGLRDIRERVPQRSLIKWLVVVIPPQSFSTEHGHLGHTLSSGSPNRLSQGILMPLFQRTAGLCLYLQTTHNGISLYPRITDESWQLLWSHLFDVRGTGMQQPQLPISGQIEFDIDFSKARWYDSWVATPKKDFADVPQSVVGHSHRPSLTHWRGDSRTTFLDEQADDQLENISIVQQTKAPRMVPKKLSLLDRFDSSTMMSTVKPPRNDSPQSPLSEAQYRVLSPIAQEEEPKTARKDVANYVSEWRASAKTAPSPLAATGQTSLDAANMPNTLVDIPIAEMEDDESVMNLDDYAWSSWRLPSPDLARRQLSDAPPTPTTATSWGAPLSYPPSPVYGYSDYAPSVDLADRAEFSRPVTPMTATSWGPPSYPQSPMYASSDYAPSVDLADRATFSRPMTPMTATSWGAPSYPGSPVSLRSGYAASIDLGGRAMSSRPATPSTATSWGPASWPASPVHYEPSSRAASPGLADRGMLSVPLTPATATSWGAPSYPVSPAFSEFRVGSPDLGARMLSAPSSPLPFRQRESPVEESAVSNMLFPYYRLCGANWQFVWPYVGGEYVDEEAKPQEEVQPSNARFPHYRLSGNRWKFTWPYIGREGAEEPLEPQEKAQPASLLVFPYYSVRERRPSPVPAKQATAPPPPPPPSRMVFPYYEAPNTMWKHVWPYQAQAERQDPIAAKYPYFNLYPAAYPAFDLYPAAVSIVPTKKDKERPVVLKGSYAAFNLYPAVYPHFDIYPAKAQRETELQPSIAAAVKPVIQVKLAARYPCFDLYPAVYPGSLEKIYPDVKMESASKGVVTKLTAAYPVFDIYPAAYPHSMVSIYPATRVKDTTERPVRAAVVYPHFDICKAAAFVVGITKTEKSKVHIKLASQYPTFDLYPAVYPTVFVAFIRRMESTRTVRAASLSTSRLSTRHLLSTLLCILGTSSLLSFLGTVHQRPGDANAKTISTALDVAIRNSTCAKASVTTQGLEFVSCIYTCPYTDVDPFLMLHPELADGYSAGSEVRREVNIRAARYPIFNIYPAVYPSFDIYPEAAGESSYTRREVKVMLCEMRYPALEIYPAVYPSFNEKSLKLKRELRVSLADTDPAVYPHFELYPAISGTLSSEPVRESVSSGATTCYPVFDIYPAVYPNFSIYPRVWVPAPVVTRKQFASAVAQPPRYAPRRKARFTHAQLHDQVFSDTLDDTCEEEELWEMITPTVVQPVSVRMSYAPPVLVFAHIANAEAADKVAPLPQQSEQPVVRRSRSGSLLNRTIPPPKPTDPSMLKPPPPPARSSSLRHSPVNSRLSVAPAGLSGRPTSGMGLPSHPAALRRASSVANGPRPMSSVSPTLRTVAEPGEERPAAYRRVAPRDSMETMRDSSRPMSRINVDVRKNTQAPRLSVEPPTQPDLQFGLELGRSNTTPASQTGRSGRRMSIVMEKAMAFGQNNSATKSTTEENPARITMTALSRFPTPPQPPLPTGAPPKGRAISKLDRSKFPFV